MIDWQPFDVFHLPPHCVSVEVEEQETFYYDGATDTKTRTITAYYDAQLSEFHCPGYGRLRGDVLRWRLLEPVQETLF